MLSTNFALSIAEHGPQISTIIGEAHQEAWRRYNHSILLGAQVQFPGESMRSKIGANKNEFISEEKLSKAYTLRSPTENPYFVTLDLGTTGVWALNNEQAQIRLDLRRSTFSLLPNARQG